MQRQLPEPGGVWNCRKVITVVGEPMALDLRVRQQHATVRRRGGRQAEILERDRQTVVPRLDPVRQELRIVDTRARGAVRVEERRRLSGRVLEAFAERESTACCRNEARFL